MRLFIYALGSGAGHLVRALSILRAIDHLEALDSADLLVSSPFLQQIIDFLPSQVKIHRVPRLPIDQRRNSLQQHCLTLIQRENHDVVLVDSFPFGIYQELPRLWEKLTASSSPRLIFLFRRLMFHYETEIFKAISAGKLPYDIIIIPNTPDLRSFSHVPVEDRKTCMKKNDFHWVGQIIANKFLFDDYQGFFEQKVTNSPLVCHTGTKHETEILKKKILELNMSRFSVQLETNFKFPLFSRLETAPWICGGAGYNLINEVTALGKPSLLFPFPREFDDQLSRLEAFSNRYPHLISLSDPDVKDKLLKCLENLPVEPSHKDFMGATKLAKLLVKQS
ncbi:MAG: hypothetical protein ACXAEU_17515 [Candidatus Hodarchaeales archaeon]|jgi:predicted glycosyltransferase